MAQVLNGNQVKLSSGQTVQAQQGGWYDGQQFWGGTLSAPGVINSQSNQQGAGQAVSKEVIAQTNPANVAYVQQQQQTYKPQPGVAQPTSFPSTEVSTSGGGEGLGITAPETINLPKLYEQLYANSGVRDIEAQLNEKTNAFNTQVSKIKDNPYLSEATMTGKIKKLEDKFNADKLATANEIATKKADIETQLNLQTKQFDINSQVAKQALEQFNSLLTSGALDNAAGEDIANLTRSTGLSSSMIQSAINANKAKNVSTSTIQYDDGTNTGFVIINDKTGEVINKQVISASKPSKTDKTTESEQETYYENSLRQDAQKGLTLSQILNLYSGYLDANLIYQLYNANSKYGADKGAKDAAGTGYLSEYGVTLFK